ncbi:MAG: ThuA domain-containing protein [Candidatus Hydrogenedentes bacterium]|nr:ThuA domain-containing protein [Candidatus Hydrogenedentota bacterium]
MKLRFVCILLIAGLLVAFGSDAAKKPPAGLPPVRCLMMGMGPHKDDTMTEVLKVVKEKYPTVAITATENLEDLRIENLKKYQVLLMVQMKVEDGNPPDFVKEGVLQFLKEGGGLVVTHFAVANVQNWRDSIDLYGAMWVSGKSTHGPYHQFRVDMKDEAHPIVQGVRPFTTNDELYFNLLMRPDLHVIMTGYEERFGHTVAEPLLATHYVHNARCVYFALGHDAQSCKTPEFVQILVQSIEWAACRR